MNIPYYARVISGSLMAGFEVNEEYVTPVLSLAYFVDHVALSAHEQVIDTGMYLVITLFIGFSLYYVGRRSRKKFEVLRCDIFMNMLERSIALALLLLSIIRVQGHLDEHYGIFEWKDIHDHDQSRRSFRESLLFISPIFRLFLGATLASFGYYFSKYLYAWKAPYVVHNVISLALAVTLRLIIMSNSNRPYLLLFCAKGIACFCGCVSQSVPLMHDVYVLAARPSGKERMDAGINLALHACICFSFGLLFMATHVYHDDFEDAWNDLSGGGGKPSSTKGSEYSPLKEIFFPAPDQDDQDDHDREI